MMTTFGMAHDNDSDQLDTATYYRPFLLIMVFITGQGLKGICAMSQNTLTGVIYNKSTRNKGLKKLAQSVRRNQSLLMTSFK